MKKIAAKKYSTTVQGKKTFQKYIHTEKGQAAKKIAAKKYSTTDQGQARRKVAEQKYTKKDKRQISKMAYKFRNK